MTGLPEYTLENIRKVSDQLERHTAYGANRPEDCEHEYIDIGGSLYCPKCNHPPADHRRTCQCGHRYWIHSGGQACLAEDTDQVGGFCSCQRWRP